MVKTINLDKVVITEPYQVTLELYQTDGYSVFPSQERWWTLSVVHGAVTLSAPSVLHMAIISEEGGGKVDQGHSLQSPWLGELKQTMCSVKPTLLSSLPSVS